MEGETCCCIDEERIMKTNFEMQKEMKAWKEKFATTTESTHRLSFRCYKH